MRGVQETRIKEKRIFNTGFMNTVRWGGRGSAGRLARETERSVGYRFVSPANPD